MSLSAPSDKFAEPAELCLALGQPLLLQVASAGTLQQCLGLPDGPGIAREDGLDQFGGRCIELGPA